jgi:hypothetical protein
VPRNEEGDEVANRGSLTLGEAIEAPVAPTPDSESPELICEPGELDPPHGLQEFDERDPARIRGPQKIGRGRPCPRWPGWIKEGRYIAGITAHCRAQGPHREAGAFEDIAHASSKLVVVWWHLAIPPGSIGTEAMVAGSVRLT